MRAPELVGTMFGQPATLRLATQPDGSVLTQIDGRLGAPALGAFIPEAFARRTAGAADWTARVVSADEGTELRVESNLKGWRSDCRSRSRSGQTSPARLP